MSLAPAPRIAVVGAGLIGRRHMHHIMREAALAGIVDPSPAARQTADQFETPWYDNLQELIDAERPDGVVVATPNRLHVEHGLACIAAGLPVLVEKPIADDVAEATRLVEAAEAKGVALLVGHHRRHNPLIRKASEVIAAGALGRIVTVQAMCWLHKPDDYFDVAWRRQAGAGPVFINLIHDIDLLRFLCGEIVSVQALDANTIRGLPVEDSAALLVRFAGGAIGTMTVSDAVAAPWSWELTAGENPAYPRTGQSCYMIGGTDGGLSLPDLGLWHYAGAKGWWEPIERRALPAGDGDPLALQIRHFCQVIAGETAPLVSGHEGLQTLKVVAAAKIAARSGGIVAIE